MAEDYSLYSDDTGGVGLRRSRKVYSPGGVLTQNAQPEQSMLPEARARLRKLVEQQAALEAAEPDTTALQAYAKQQGQAGDSAMLNALAAQFAGESFAPVQTQFLKRAAAAKEPMKVGGGMLTPDGQFVRDPFATREREMARMDRLIGAERDDITATERAQQQRLDRQVQSDIANQFRQQGLNLQQQGLDLRREIAANRPVDNTKAFRTADNLRGEYTKRADKVREGTGHAQNVLTLLSDPTIARDPTKQVSLVFSFGKMLDPESVVRESEYSLIANARGLYDTLQQMIPQLQTGAKLSPQQLKSMQAIAASLMNGSTGRLDDLTNYYRDLAIRRNVDPQDVLPSYATRPSAAPGGTPDLAAAARAELERRKAQK